MPVDILDSQVVATSGLGTEIVKVIDDVTDIYTTYHIIKYEFANGSAIGEIHLSLQSLYVIFFSGPW